MLCFRSRNSSPSLLFFTLFLFASSTLSVAKLHVVLHVDQEVLNEKEHGGLLSSEKWRSLVEEAPVDNSSLILAEKRTYRKDFFNDLKYYSGGWNISNSHYWTSVFSTGIPFFGFAVAWFVFFGLCLCFICLHHCCCLREPYGYSRIAYALSLIFLIIFTIAAIAGCIVLYTGQGKFHISTTNTLNYVVHQANITAEKLEDVSGYLDALKGISGGSVILPPKDIDNIELKINFAATLLSSQAGKNSENIKNFLDQVRLSLIILAAIMLFLSFLGFLFSIVGMQCLVYFLVIIGWILVTGTFILCGVFLLLHNVVADTCIAMDEWVLNPTAHTALDDILPCVDNATAHETLLKTKQVTYGLVNGINGIIGGVSNLNVPQNAGPQVYYNQSGPLMPLLCNPFNSDLSDRQCAAGEVELSNASQAFKNYTCEVSASGICTTPGRITPTVYNNIESAVYVSYGLNQYGPFLIDLQDCTFVRDTFTDISRGYCPGLQRYTQWIYIGLLLVSAAVMLSLIFWVVYARERRHRVYAKRFMNLSS